MKSFSDGFQYASTFLDDHPRYFLISYMRHRHMLGQMFTLISEKFVIFGGAQISKFHSDGAKEYLALQKYLGGVDDENKFFLRRILPN